MSFGGAIKLTGETEYRRALKQITSDLKSTSNALKAQANDFSTNNKAMSSTAAKEKELTAAINAQKAAIATAQSSYSRYTVALQTQQTRHNALNKEYKAAVLELDRIKKSSGETSNEYKKQAQEVARLEGELVESTDEMDKSKRAMSALKSEINNATKTMNAAEKEVDELGNETKQTGEQAKDAKEGFTVFKGVLANLASQAIGAAINGLKKLGGALVDVGKQSVASYAQYEQLVGGVETLFKDSAEEVKKYADIAYQTAGMSANEYMETVTGFSASLLQGLGGDTAKAAKIADMAILDMADNANKMGTSMESIQYAYQGFAKQNFTMLDNLKLGFGGSAGEMARLINQTGVMGKAFKATAKNVKEVPFDKMIEAIHKVQEEMGITGTTSLEASGTIEGSAKSMKAAWSNLLTGIADDNADLSKSIDIFTNSAITSANNLVPRVKRIVTTIKNLALSIVTEVFPKIKREVPQLRPLIETFEWFIDNKQLVVGAVGAMVGAFATAKILSFTKGLSDVIKSLITAATATAAETAAKNANTAAEVTNTAAKVTATGATGALTVAQNLLNAAWAANPVGVVIAGLAALAGVIALVASKTKGLTDEEKAQQKAMEEQHEQLQANKEAWADLTKEQQNQINVGMTETAHLESLWDELQGIVDQNGKVKKGYEERASFITSTLSEALGIEISNVKGVIGEYDKLKKSIDDVMEKKKAQIILDSQETLYKEAIQKQDEALQGLQTTSETYITKKQELTNLENELDKLRAGTNGYYSAQAINNTQAKIDAKKREVDEAAKDYKAQQDLYGEYAYNIGLYEQNMAAFHAGKYDEMSTATWDYVKDYQGAEQAEKKMLEDKVKVTNEKLKQLEKLKKDSNSNIYDDQIKAAKKEKAQLESQLKAYESTTKSGLKKTEIVWSDSLDEQLSDITGSKVEFKNAGNGQVQAYVDGEKVGAPKAKEEMAKIATDSIKEITKKDKDAKKAGENLIEGVNNGVKNQDKQSGVFRSISNFGSTLLSKLKASLKEKSPSKATEEMGVFLLKGLQNGIKAETKAVNDQVKSFSKDLLKLFGGNSSDYKTKANSLIKSFDKGIESAIKTSKTKVKGIVDTYFKDLQTENEKKQEKLTKEYEKKAKALQNKINNTKNKTAKANLKKELDTLKTNYKKQLDTLKDQNKEIKTLYNEFGKTAISEYDKALTEATKGVTDKLTEKISKLSEKMQAEIDAVNSKIASMQSKLSDYGDLFTTQTDESGKETVLLTDINKQTKTLKKYSKNLNKLKGKISDELMGEITNMSVDDAIKYTNELLKLNDKQLSDYNEAYTKKQKQAAKIAESFYADQLKQIKEKYTDKIKAEFEKAKKEIKNIGTQTMKGFIKGMESSNYSKEIKKIANNLVKQMKKALGIKSPSKVFADEIGVNSALGIEQGFVNEMASVTKEMQAAIPTKFNAKVTAEVERSARRDANEDSRLVTAFKTALSQMKIELDDEIAGKFVENTVTRVVYS